MPPEKLNPNRLIDEKSPYLLQHAHNPVDWHPWGPEALALAKEQDKINRERARDLRKSGASATEVQAARRTAPPPPTMMVCVSAS